LIADSLIADSLIADLLIADCFDYAIQCLNKTISIF